VSLMYRIRVASSGWTGGPGLNTFYFQNVTDPTTSDSTNAALCVAGVQAAFTAQAGIYPTQTSLQVAGTVDVLNAATGALVDSFGGTSPSAISGTGSVGYAPIVAMIVGRLNTADVVNGHRVRGRAFFGPVQDLTDTDGTPNDTIVAAVADLVNYLQNTVDAAIELVVWHRPVSGAGGQACPVTSTSARDIYAVLRSRRD